MGKGNRTRNERANDALATAAPRKAAKKGMPTWAGTLIVVAVLALVFIFVTLSVLSSRGVFVRNTVLVESENYEVTVPMMSYMIATEYESLVNMYSQWGSGISIGGGTGGNALDTSSTAPSLSEQIYSVTTDAATGVTTTKTWLQYFAESALKDVKQVIACCEEASKLGIKLSDTDKDNIDMQLDALGSYALAMGYSDTAGYLSARYGKGVSKGDVRKMLEMIELASQYTNLKTEEYKNALTDERINDYYSKNKTDYETYIDYVGYTFTASFTPTKDTEGATEKNAQLNEEYKAQQEKYKGYMEQLNACNNADEFLNKLYELVLQDEKDKIKAEKGADYVLTEDDVKKCDEKARAAQEGATVLNYAKPAGALTGLDAWLFESKTEGEGDNKVTKYLRVEGEKGMKDNVTNVVVEGSNAYKAVSSTYGAGIVLKAMHRNDDPVRSVGHILFESETYDNKTSSADFSGVIKVLADKVLARDGVLSAETMAAELVELMKKEGKLVEKVKENGTKYFGIEESVFKTYGELYTGDGNVFYTDVEKGQMVAEYENWLFADGRVEGEVETVKTKYGYHIMYYKGDEKATWYADVSTTISNEDLTAHLEKIEADNAITAKDLSDKDWSKIGL